MNVVQNTTVPPTLIGKLLERNKQFAENRTHVFHACTYGGLLPRPPHSSIVHPRFNMQALYNFLNASSASVAPGSSILATFKKSTLGLCDIFNCLALLLPMYISFKYLRVSFRYPTTTYCFDFPMDDELANVPPDTLENNEKKILALSDLVVITRMVKWEAIISFPEPA